MKSNHKARWISDRVYREAKAAHVQLTPGEIGNITGETWVKLKASDPSPRVVYEEMRKAIFFYGANHEGILHMQRHRLLMQLQPADFEWAH